jgi:cytochrome c oxidase subunit 3
MKYLPKANFQNHPFLLVSPSPCPLYTSLSLFVLTCAAALFMHGFELFQYIVLIAIFNLIYSMSL